MQATASKYSDTLLASHRHAISTRACTTLSHNDLALPAPDFLGDIVEAGECGRQVAGEASDGDVEALAFGIVDEGMESGQGLFGPGATQRASSRSTSRSIGAGLNQQPAMVARPHSSMPLPRWVEPRAQHHRAVGQNEESEGRDPCHGGPMQQQGAGLVHQPTRQPGGGGGSNQQVDCRGRA